MDNVVPISQPPTLHASLHYSTTPPNHLSQRFKACNERVELLLPEPFLSHTGPASISLHDMPPLVTVSFILCHCHSQTHTYTTNRQSLSCPSFSLQSPDYVIFFFFSSMKMLQNTIPMSVLRLCIVHSMLHPYSCHFSV